MKKVQQGFTLIELMIVVAIIGILASIAVPQYQNFIQKTEFKEVTSVAGGDWKVGVELCAQEEKDLSQCVPSWSGALGKIPADAAAITFANGNQIATLTTTGNGVITATTGATDYAQTSASTYIMTPAMATGLGGNVIWTVSGNCITRGLCSQ